MSAAMRTGRLIRYTRLCIEHNTIRVIAGQFVVVWQLAIPPNARAALEIFSAIMILGVLQQELVDEK